MIIHLLICQLLGIASASTVQSYQEREKAFWDWQHKQEEQQKKRRSAEDKQRADRLRREQDAIRRRESFVRVYKTMTAQESEHSAKLERLERQRNAKRESYAEDHHRALQYYEKHILPLKKTEYDLTEPKEDTEAQP